MHEALSHDEILALAGRIDRPLVLVGMMGVGKTSIGKRLAGLLNLGFVDADEEIERAAQLTIPEIFEQFGEPYFRDGERRVIARLMDGPPRIIATGGGAFANADTRALVLSRGLAIWLDTTIDVLLDRVARKDNRPLLKQGNPREVLERLLAERKDAYAQAPIHVTSGPGPQARTVDRILKELKRCL